MKIPQEIQDDYMRTFEELRCDPDTRYRLQKTRRYRIINPSTGRILTSKNTLDAINYVFGHTPRRVTSELYLIDSETAEILKIKPKKELKDK